jgi:hypothetical protein
VPPSTPSTSSSAAAPSALLGRTEPRLWTPPLRDLGTAERPNYDATYGWDVIEFARDVLGQPLDPWQCFAVVHGGELLADGRPRFRTVLLLVSRQQGKTHLMRVLTLFWLFVEHRKMVLGMSTTLAMAKETWTGALEMAQECEWISPLIGKVGLNNGQEYLRTTAGAKYKIAAANRAGGRGLTVHRLIVDEIREHKSWDAWDAATPTMTAVRDAQAWCLTNQGDDRSIVLDQLRADALEFLETGNGNERLGILEWSAPDGADPEDIDALAQANPTLGGRTDPDVLLGPARAAKAAGGQVLAKFRTEYMCQRVHMLDPAIDPDSWDATTDPTPVDLAEHRDQVVACLDISLDGSHATLVVAAVLDGIVHSEVVRQWDGVGCSQAVRTDLPSLLGRVRPRVLAWFPSGPAAALAADLAKNPNRRGWPPRGTKLVELRAEDSAVACMELAEQVQAGQLRRPADALLDQHVRSSTRLWRGDRWVFQRAGSSPIDAAYALGGAVHEARRLPKRARLVAVKASRPGQ